MDILGSNIFDQMARLQEGLNEFASRVEVGFPDRAEDDLWRPPVDIFEREEELVLSMDLPGLDREDIELRVDGASLTIEGEREPREEGTCVRRERPAGRFRRSFRLAAPVDTSQVKASYRDGVLEIRLPKVSPPHPVRLEIESG